MQTSELELKDIKLLGDEECIHFRPSPNFKHMKKYLKSKFEESNSSPNQSSDSTTPNSEEQETVKNVSTNTGSASSMAQRVQPPLPLNSPPLLLVVPKKEVKDEEYNDRLITKQELKTEKEEVTAAPQVVFEKIMCRQFARGMCNRGNTCIYAHELILSQLPGVYTFCKNFQNTICNYPKCKFVHATVFEKEHFYRTGYLPPQTLLHLKESNSQLVPTAILEGTPSPTSTWKSPATMNSGEPGAPPALGVGTADGRPTTDVTALMKSPGKRDWTEMDSVSRDDDDVLDERNDSSPKKCKACYMIDIREELCKAEIETLKADSVMYRMQKMKVMEKHNLLNELFKELVKRNCSQLSSMPPIMTNRAEKENQHSSLLEQLNRLLQLNIIQGGDHSENILLSKLLKALKDSNAGSRFNSTNTKL